MSIIWEYFENSSMYDLRMKYENKRDSMINVLYDITLWDIGSLISLYSNIIINIILILIEVSFFIIYFRFVRFDDGERMSVIKYYRKTMNYPPLKGGAS
jgi:hypothetical protein